MSWKCDYIFEDAAKTDPYQYDGLPTGYDSHSSGYAMRTNEKVNLSKTLFCDDGCYATSTVLGAQYILDKIGLFAAASGMEINVTKTFVVPMNMGEQDLSNLDMPLPIFDLERHNATGTVYEYQQPIQRLPIAKETPDKEWRHLGNYQSNN